MPGPEVWGPFGWKFIHYITTGYPNNPTNEDKIKYLNFFNSLQYVLPCSICSHHFQENMKINPLTDEILSDKTKFIEWGIAMHNLVNISTGKKVYTMEEGIASIKQNNKMENNMHNNMHEHTEKIENFTNSTNYSTYIIIILIIIIIIIIVKYIKKKS
jgi:hypothetical protein